MEVDPTTAVVVAPRCIRSVVVWAALVVVSVVVMVALVIIVSVVVGVMVALGSIFSAKGHMGLVAALCQQN